jgi:hypothetical protein
MRIRNMAGTAALAAGVALLAMPACALTVANPIVAASGDTIAAVSFDASTVFGSAGSTFAAAGVYGFALPIPGGVNFSGGSVTFNLPEIVVASAAGWVLSDLHTFLGNLSFSESGAGSTSARISGFVRLGGQPPVLIGTDMDKTVTSSTPLVSSQGFYSTEQTMSGTFSDIRFAGGQLTLTAAPGSGFAANAGQTPTELRLSFNAVAVPETGTWALLTAGLLWVIWAVRRRRPARY